MRVTYKGDYALKTILDLALRDTDVPVAIHDLAKRADIPVKFLEQILLDLKRGGFVISRRGKVGGYLLARPASKITVGQVIRFIDGPIEPIACVNNKYRECSDINKCIFRDMWRRVSEAVCGIIDKVTFEDLAKKIRKADSALVYQI